MAEQRKDDFQEQELERYGVWVKAGPEEVVEAEEEDYSFADLPSDSAAGSEPTDTGMNLDSDLDSLEIPEGDYSMESLDTMEDIDEIGSIDDLGSLEEFDEIQEIGSRETPADDELPEIEDLNVSGDLASLDEIDTDDLGSLDDFGAFESEEPLSLEETDDELPMIDEVEEIDEMESLDEMEIEDEISSMDELASTSGFSREDEEDLVTLDDLDIEEPDSDQDPFAALEVESGGLDSLEEEAGIESIMPGNDDEIDEISLEDIQFSDAADGDIPELEEEEHHFTPEEQDIEIVPRSRANVLSPEEEEILDAEGAPAAPLGSHPMEEDERRAFEKIQRELDDIKTELAELRAALRSGAAVQLAEPEAGAVEDEDGLHHGPGFFEEDEDETIALTGDELDNILNTAEFTEETGETEELEEDFVAAATAIGAPPEEDEVEEISEITLDDSAEAVIDELADMNIEAELADIESLEDISEDEPAADELELDLDEIEEIGGDADLLLEEEVEEVPVDETDLELSDADLELDETELEVDDEMAFEEFAAAVEDDLAGTDVLVEDDEDLQVEEIDLDAGLEAPTLDQDEDVLEMPAAVDVSAEGRQNSIADLPAHVKNEIRSVLSYMDQLLEALPDDKIEEFAQSEHFEVYKRLFEELGLET